MSFRYHKSHLNTGDVGTFAYLSPDEPVIKCEDSGQVYPCADSNRALDGDLVYFTLGSGSDTETTFATVTGIKSRGTKIISGLLQITQIKISGHNKKGIPIYTMVPLSWRFPSFMVASKVRDKWKDGSVKDVYVLVEFREWKETDKYPHGNCLNILGYDSVALDWALLHKNMLYVRTHKKRTQAQPIQDKRVNYGKSCHILAIDPVGATDFDDAFHVRENYVYVHIADVDHYFPQDGPYEEEITKRMSSIYSEITGVHHMIPTEYSSKIISLNKSGLKPALTVRFAIHQDGCLVPDDVHLSNVEVHANMTYEAAQKLVNSDTEPEPQLRKLSMILGESDTHKIVERLMIMTNSYIGELLHKHGTAFGRVCSASTGSGSAIDVPCLEYLTYRNESGAQYTATDSAIEEGHQRLNLKYYTHFTSPIRRYADLIVHRLVKDIIARRPPSYTKEQLQHIAKKLNTYNSQIKRYYRDAAVIKLYWTLNDQGVIYTDGYLVEYTEEGNQIHVYLPDYDIEYRYPLFSQKLKHIMSAKDNTQSLTITNNQNGESWEIPKYQRLQFSLHTNSTAIYLSRKVVMRVSSIEDTFALL